jgi:hypothetical protein
MLVKILPKQKAAIEQGQSVGEAGGDEPIRGARSYDLRAEAEAGDPAFTEPRHVIAVEGVPRRIRGELGSRGEQDLAGGQEGRRVGQV